MKNNSTNEKVNLHLSFPEQMCINEVNLIFKSRIQKNASHFAIVKIHNPAFLHIKHYEQTVSSGKRLHCRKAFRLILTFLYMK